MTDEIIDFVVAQLEKKAPVPGTSLVEKQAYKYLEAGHIDSFALTGFIITIEDKFDIILSPEDMQSDDFRSIGGLVKIVIRNMAER
ncbi:MAG: hypothetical protein HQ513_13715 [Rhodospirillales bacterium]|nr:hypothetical protein [Rhodospirillales bacterium]